MSIMENARHLMEAAGEVVNDAVGAATSAASHLEGTDQDLARVQEIIENTTQTAATLLGEDHPAVGTLTGTAAVVSEKVTELHGQVEALRAAITELDALIIQHGDAMQQAGQRAMGQ